MKLKMKTSLQLVLHIKTQLAIVVGGKGTLHPTNPSENLPLSVNVIRTEPCKICRTTVMTPQLIM